MDLLAHVDSALEAAHMDAIDALRAFFLLAAATSVSVSIPSALHDRFLLYGPRATVTATGSEPVAGSRSAAQSQTQARSSGSSLLDYLATWQVPHSYFTQFYVASVASSVFWAAQLCWRGRVFEAIASRVSEEHLKQSMSLTQVLICWVLLAIQGSRRLWESIAFAKPSSSKMWFAHWLLGLGFYLAAGVAIWIEGSGAILTRSLTLADFQFTNAPTIRTFVCVPLFLIASGLQHDCHHFLFSLKKYTLPDHPIFRGIVCPHYGAECLIYLSLTYLAAPPGQVVNKTMLSSLAFVAVNLGLTARNTKKWYMQKFGREAVQDRWLMIPYIY
ncbi:uncharacterized protein N7496_009831 [Penicillium cataractarum]|uniref:Polyprenal reductase n=1 Tax=Penicillium cataractarum TaxID=2100454 RepID=A0A9W9V0A0_9EURO|nr:uncharacterized protein N7496_009831 [Penicillium cataractarum]KAJ5364118.1 hypothetical protein N7496_009831 [Penicillium cataractarum]